MTAPKSVLEEGFHNHLLVVEVGHHGVHQVRVVKQDACGLLGEVFAWTIEHVEQTGICQVLDVVHYCCTAGLQVLSQLTDVGSSVIACSKQVEQLLYLCQILQVDLLDEQDVHLNHHVDCLQQVLDEACFLEEEGVVSVMQIVVEVVERIDLLQDFLSNVLVSVLNLTNGVGTEVCSCPEVQVFAEREATQVVACADAIQLGILLFQSHHA